MTEIRDVQDWTTDWDHHHPDWVNDPFPIWDELRQGCPVAHTDRYNEGIWFPTRYEDLTAIARDPETFSSDHNGATAGGSVDRVKLPPIHLDPPEHMDVRRVLLPFFTPQRMKQWEPAIREHCEELARSLAGRDEVDIAQDYAAHIPASAIATILGIPASVGEQFRIWMHWFELGDNNTELRDRAIGETSAYFAAEIADRRNNPSDDLIGYLVTVEIDGERFDDDTLQRILVLILIAGIDTTWGMIGASLWHLSTHAEDRRRLVAEPELLPTALEEFLRAYASVSLYRRVTKTTTIGDTTMQAGDTVLMAFPAACRDPEVFDRADEVVIDRKVNRHVAFGAGIHRCLGSNLARIELAIAVETWLRFVPEFELLPDAQVTWAEGALRGPRSIPVSIG
jgi:cytochrome P450